MRMHGPHRHRALVALLWGLLLGLAVATPTAGHAGLPVTPLPLFDGGTLDLRSLQGQVVVIRFLASW